MAWRHLRGQLELITRSIIAKKRYAPERRLAPTPSVSLRALPNDVGEPASAAVAGAAEGHPPQFPAGRVVPGVRVQLGEHVTDEGVALHIVREDQFRVAQRAHGIVTAAAKSREGLDSYRRRPEVRRGDACSRRGGARSGDAVLEVPGADPLADRSQPTSWPSSAYSQLPLVDSRPLTPTHRPPSKARRRMPC